MPRIHSIWHWIYLGSFHLSLEPQSLCSYGMISHQSLPQDINQIQNESLTTAVASPCWWVQLLPIHSIWMMSKTFGMLWMFVRSVHCGSGASITVLWHDFVPIVSPGFQPIKKFRPNSRQYHGDGSICPSTAYAWCQTHLSCFKCMWEVSIVGLEPQSQWGIVLDKSLRTPGFNPDFGNLRSVWQHLLQHQAEQNQKKNVCGQPTMNRKRDHKGKRKEWRNQHISPSRRTNLKGISTIPQG